MLKKIMGFKMSSFFDVGVEHHIDRNGVLSKIDALINWRRIEKILGDVHSDLGVQGMMLCGYLSVFCYKVGIV